MSPPPVGVAGLQLNEWVVPGRPQVHGWIETAAEDVLERLSELDVQQCVDDVVGREAD